MIQLDQNGFFIGTAIIEPSPLEPGRNLIPAGAVDAPAPELPAEHRAKWAGDRWLYEPIPKPEPEPEPEPVDPVKQAQDIVDAELREIDLASIRSMREYIAALPDAPQPIKDHEAAAAAKRAARPKV